MIKLTRKIWYKMMKKIFKLKKNNNKILSYNKIIKQKN